MSSAIDDILGRYGGAPSRFEPDRQSVMDDMRANAAREAAWDAATGDANEGYAMRLPGPLASVRRSAADVLGSAFGWMTPDQRNTLMLAAAFATPGALRGAPKNGMLRKTEAGYIPPASASPRPFRDDYPRAPEGDTGSRLTTDIEGRPLGARYVAGRREVGGHDVALTPEEILDIAQSLGSVRTVPKRELPRNSFGEYVPSIGEVRIRDGMSPEATGLTLAHETGHLLDDTLRFRNRPIDLEGSAVAARKVYSDLAGGDLDAIMPRHFRTPAMFGYSQAQARDEYIAEALRAYMQNPDYMKRTAPKLAAAIRGSVNADPHVSKFIQFNAPLVPGIIAGYHALAPQSSEAADDAQ